MELTSKQILQSTERLNEALLTESAHIQARIANANQ